MSTRAQNEKKPGQWDELPGGGRRYRLDLPGRLGLIEWLMAVCRKSFMFRRFLFE